MPAVKYTGTFDIKTALKIVRHISSGIYRDLSGSLKELVSNSFDAQATEVEIWSGAPRFDTITIKDNGLGFTEEVLLKAFENVGLSLKVTHPEWYTGKFGRPIIGRFGIGFLASAHISKDLLIRTFHDRDKPGLEIHMDLSPYFRYMNKVQTTDEYHFGSIQYGPIDNSERGIGTTIELRHVRDGDFLGVISAEGLGLAEWPRDGTRGAADGKLMERYVAQVQNQNIHALPKLNGRNQLLWHLGMNTPVRYLDDGPIDQKFGNADVRTIVNRLRDIAESFNFRVWFDGIEVRKPLLLPTPESKRGDTEEGDVGAIDDCHAWPVRIDGAASNGNRVKAEGYLFFQPYRVIPVEIRGLLPRVAGVGVGATFDNSFLRDLKSESPLFRVQVSGELYILRGLDEALNLDRSGFLEVDAEFRFLASKVSEIVYQFVREASKIRRKRNQRINQTRETKDFDRRVALLGSMFRQVGLNYAVDPVTSAALDKLGRAQGRFAYPAGQPRLVVDRAGRKCYVDFKVENPTWSATIALVDQLLAQTTNPSEARRKFAEGLRKIEQAGEDGSARQ
jgi:hypothetical protein